MSTMTKITDGLGEFNAATGKAQIAIAGIGLLVSAIRAIVDKAKGSGIDMQTYEQALAGFDAAEARVRAELSEYDTIKAQEGTRGKSEDSEA